MTVYQVPEAKARMGPSSAPAKQMMGRNDPRYARDLHIEMAQGHSWTLDGTDQLN